MITDLSDTKIKVNSPEESERVQKRAFELGWKWFNKKFKVSNTEDKYLYFFDKIIRCGAIETDFKTHTNREITLKDLFEKEEESLDGKIVEAFDRNNKYLLKLSKDGSSLDMKSLKRGFIKDKKWKIVGEEKEETSTEEKSTVDKKWQPGTYVVFLEDYIQHNGFKKYEIREIRNKEKNRIDYKPYFTNDISGPNSVADKLAWFETKEEAWKFVTESRARDGILKHKVICEPHPTSSLEQSNSEEQVVFPKNILKDRLVELKTNYFEPPEDSFQHQIETYKKIFTKELQKFCNSTYSFEEKPKLKLINVPKI